MTTINVIMRSGISKDVNARHGRSLMEDLRDAGVDDIIALCGGNCSCATCHVYVEPNDIMSEMTADESEMLDTLVYQRPASRLACQVYLNGDVSHLRVQVAPSE